MSEENNMTVEEAFEELDFVIEKLEDKDISLEDSFKVYNKGIELLKFCSEKIDTVEKKMMQINDNGELNEF